MNYESIVIGLASFVIIGLFHPIVIQTEYHCTKKAWPVFLIVGVVLLIAAVFIDRMVIAAIVSITGFTCLWSIKELYEQEKRVKRGWFPSKPKRSSPETRSHSK